MDKIRYFVNGKETTKGDMPYAAGKYLDNIGIYDFLYRLLEVKESYDEIIIYVKKDDKRCAYHLESITFNKK